MYDLGPVHTIPDISFMPAQKQYKLGLLFTHKTPAYAQFIR